MSSKSLADPDAGSVAVDMSEAAVTRRLEEVRALYKLMQSFRESRDALPKGQRLD